MSPGAIRIIPAMLVRQQNSRTRLSTHGLYTALFPPSDLVRSDCLMVEITFLWALFPEGTLARRNIYQSPAQH